MASSVPNERTAAIGSAVPDRPRPRIGRIDQEVVGDQDQAGEDGQAGIGGGTPIEPDGLGPQQHLGRRDREAEGRVHHGERDLGEHPDLAGDPQGVARLVREIAMTATAKTCSIIHVGLWKRWRTRRARLREPRCRPVRSCPRGAPHHRSPAMTPRRGRCPPPPRSDAGDRGGRERSSPGSACGSRISPLSSSSWRSSTPDWTIDRTRPSARGTGGSAGGPG